MGPQPLVIIQEAESASPPTYTAFPPLPRFQTALDQMSTDAHHSAGAVEGEDSLPRDPAAYRPGIHFGERFKDNYDEYNRHLDGEIIDGCIIHGTASRRDADIYHLRETFGGVTYRLVVDVAKHRVVTGYPISINTEVARGSGRWSSNQIDDICAFIASKYD